MLFLFCYPLCPHEFADRMIWPDHFQWQFSGQCLLISVATAVDYASECMFGGGKIATLDNEVLELLSRSLHRLGQAREEMTLNCEDEQQLVDMNKMTVLLALRCLLEVGCDTQANESLNNNGLYNALQKIHLNSPNQDDDEFVILRNVKLMADLAEERNMKQTSRTLQRLCAESLSQTGRFVLDIDGYEMSLGEIQQKIIMSASSAKEVIDVYQSIDALVEKKHPNSFKKGGVVDDDTFYSVADLTWFAKDANNRAVQHDLLGDYDTATKLFATALNLLPYASKELQTHSKAVNAAYQDALNRTMNRDTLSEIWNLVAESH